jgi:hypothetical protein
MKQGLIQVIEEQTFLNFTGVINVLESSKNMLLGSIYLFEGQVINTLYHNFEGMQALESLFFLEFEGASLNFVTEPEMVTNKVRRIHYPFKTLKKKIESLIESTSLDQKEVPPMALKLMINSNIIDNGQSLTSDEFDVLKTLCDYNIVKDVYNNCKIAKHRVTNALVQLRRKKALKVIK